jgi:hypothetical protein
MGSDVNVYICHEPTLSPFIRSITADLALYADSAVASVHKCHD